MAAESSWCWPWLSSGTAWFLFFNVVVGIVAVLSWAQGGDAPIARRRRLTRSASSMVMERLRSMSLFAAFHSDSVPEPDYGSSLTSPASLSQLHHVQDYYTSSQVEGGEEVGHVVTKPKPALAPVAESLTVTMAPSTTSAPDAAAAEPGLRSVASVSGSDKAGAEARTETSGCLRDACAVVVRQRDAPAPTPATVAAKGATTERPRKREKAKVAETVGRRAYAEEVGEKAEVNARAERFIRQFREELKLERIKSILNHSAAASAR